MTNTTTETPPRFADRDASIRVTLAEMLSKYDEARAAAVQHLGADFDERAFHDWFTAQALGDKETRA